MNTGMILLVEDDEHDELLTLTALKKWNIVNKVIVARDGAEALDYLSCSNRYADRDRNDLPLLIVLDIKLPKLNGLEVLERIHSDPRTQRLLVVLFSSSDEVQDVKQAYARRANSYLVKPIDFRQYVDVIGELGLYWLAVSEPCPN